MSEGGAESRLSGELSASRRGFAVTILMALTGITFVRSAARVIGRFVFSYRRPADVTLSERGLRISSRTELLGRVLRETETVIPLANLSSVSREVKYPRLGMSAGILALAVGTYVGTGLLVDGVRVPGGSPSLLGLGLAAIALGVVMDFGLNAIPDAIRNTCCLVVEPYRGAALCIQGLEREATDRVLIELATATAENG